MRIILSLALLGINWFCLHTYAQTSRTFTYIKYGEQHGLLGVDVYGLNQDKDGYIWVGTDNGLYKFDGSFFSPVFLPGESPSRVVERVYRAGNEKLLVVGSFPSRMYLLHRNNLSFSDSLSSMLSVNGRLHFMAGVDNLLFWRKGTAYILDSLTPYRIHHIENFPTCRYNTIHAFNKDSFFIATMEDAFCLPNGKQHYPELRNATNLLQLGDSSLVFVNDSVYTLRANSTRLFGTIPTPPNVNIKVHFSLKDRKGNIWFSGRRSGLYIIQNGQIKNVAKSLDLEGEQITYLFLDRTGNVWISTASSGLICVLESNFTHYSKEDGLSSNYITTICEWKGRIYAGTNTGVNQVSDLGILGPLDWSKNWNLCRQERATLKGYVFDLEGTDECLGVSSDAYSKQHIWCYHDSLFCRSSSSFTIQGDTIHTARWGYQVDVLRSKEERRYVILDRKKLNSTKEYFIKSTGRKSFYIGTSNGVLFKSTEDEEYHQLDVPLDTVGYSYFDAGFDQNGNLWFGTTAGLMRYGKDGSWKQFTTEQGLISNTIKCLVFDITGKLWLGTDKGLCYYDGTRFGAYTKGNGLISNTINALHYRKSDHSLWIGTNNGLSKLNLFNEIKIVKGSPPLYVTRFQIIGDSVYEVNNFARLKWRQNHIRISYASLDYSDPTEVVYQFRLKPGDRQWSQTTERSVQFLSLAPGRYTFEVRSKSSGSEWGQIAKISFTIEPPIWKRIGFWLILIPSILSLVWFYIAMRYRKVRDRERKRNELLQRLSYLEQQALSLSMNPHFVFNSLNSIQHFFSDVDDEEAHEYIADFAELIRLNMESSQNRYIALKEEVRRLSLYLSLEQTRFDKKLDFSIEVDPELLYDNPDIPNMLIQPLVENAIWHGILPSNQDGSIDIHIYLRDALYVTVSDNGIGLKAAHKQRSSEHVSKGLSITRERLRHYSEGSFLEIEEVLSEKGDVLGTRA
ncbi:MAG: histidine kinase, partial [Bacteroidia bacterium]|nr:histidine kinase [Bacteroidia bacterium]